MEVSEFYIRAACASDKSALFRLFEQVQSIHANALPDFFRPPKRDDAFDHFFDGLMSDPEQFLIFAEANGKSAGYCQYFIGDRPKNLYQPDRRFAYVHGLAVDSAFRRRRCATALLNHVRAHAKEQNASGLGIDFWSFNDPARACFRAAGFEVNQEKMWMPL